MPNVRSAELRRCGARQHCRLLGVGQEKRTSPRRSGGAPVVSAPHAGGRILLVVSRELTVQRRILDLKINRSVEEELAAHGEELARILGGVRVDPRLLAPLDLLDEL